MPFKTILTVTQPGLGEGDLKIAKSLCESAGAHLAALVVQMAAPPPIGEFAGWRGSQRSTASRPKNVQFHAEEQTLQTA
jgi:hypothetical protein